MVGIVVADMARALAFYRLLGLEIPDGQDDEPFVEVITPNGYRISWNTQSMIQSIDPHWTPPTGSPRVSLAFKCDTPAEVDNTYAKITATTPSAADKAPWDAFWGQRYAILRDPDNNPVDLFAPL